MSARVRAYARVREFARVFVFMRALVCVRQIVRVRMRAYACPCRAAGAVMASVRRLRGAYKAAGFESSACAHAPATSTADAQVA
jgi:hypothetical protein